MSNLYGIFYTDEQTQKAMWQLRACGKADAIREAKRTKALVGVLRNYRSYGVGAWDALTFKITMTPLEDYRTHDEPRGTYQPPVKEVRP